MNFSLPKKKLYFTFAVFYLFFFSSAGFSNNNISYIDLNFLLDETNLGNKIFEEINLKNKENIRYLTDKENVIKNKEIKIKQTQNVISDEKFKEELSKLDIEISEFIEEKRRLSDQFEIFRQKKFNEFFSKIKPIIEDYMNNKSITILLEKKNIFMGKLDNEITADIVKLINKLY